MVKCPNENYIGGDYIGETDRRIEERIIDYNESNKSSRLRHAREMEHHPIWHEDFEIIGSNYRSSFKRKISEALFAKQFKPTLNKKEQSIQLQL